MIIEFEEITIIEFEEITDENRSKLIDVKASKSSNRMFVYHPLSSKWYVQSSFPELVCPTPKILNENNKNDKDFIAELIKNETNRMIAAGQTVGNTAVISVIRSHSRRVHVGYMILQAGIHIC